MYKEAFTNELKKIIEESGIRQRQLADELQLSGAAVSQFIHGVTLPTFRHMDIIFAKLKISADRAFYIKNLLAYARSDGRDSGFTAFNRNLLAMRSNSGYTLPRLAARIGISVGRLSALENDFETIPTADEIARIKDFFGCSPDEFSDLSTLSNSARLAEHSSAGIPKITFEDLLGYNADCPLYEYANKVLRDYIPRSFDGYCDPVILEVDARKLNFPYDGTLNLTLTCRQPIGFIALELVRYENDIFRIEQPAHNDSVCQNVLKVLWRNPVAEIKFMPVLSLPEEKM